MSSKARRREEDNEANGSPDKTELELNCHPIYGDGNVCRCAAQCICNDRDQEEDYKAYICSRYARIGSKYRRKKDAQILKEIRKEINLHELKSKSATILDFYDDIFHVISKYLYHWELKMFKRTCKRFNQLELKSAPTIFVHDEMHSVNHKCGYMYNVAKISLARQRRLNAMFVLIVVYLLCS